MRNRFDSQLEKLGTQLIGMGALCEQSIQTCYAALSDSDAELAAQTIEADEWIDRKEREIESMCLKLLLHQQPVAKDLRFVSAALKMITDMERIGDQAADIAEIVVSGAIGAGAAHDNIAGMARIAGEMVTASIDAYVKKEVCMAERAMEKDDQVDALFVLVRTELIAAIEQRAQDAQQALDMLMIAKYFERIGDHAANIAQWVRFSLTGQH